jgi:hypothetical protein
MIAEYFSVHKIFILTIKMKINVRKTFTYADVFVTKPDSHFLVN